MTEKREPTSSANHPSQPRRLLATQRRRKAFQMKLAGATEYEIAQTLGVSQPAVSKMLNEARVDLSDQTKLDRDEYRRIQRADIFQALAVVRSKLTSTDAGEQLAAIDRLEKLHTRLSRLEGLDEPEEQKTSGSVTLTVVYEDKKKKAEDAPND
jgi:predicted transcriptional regulator